MPLCTLPVYFLHLNVSSETNYYSVPSSWILLWPALAFFAIHIGFFLLTKDLSVVLFFQIASAVVAFLWLRAERRTKAKEKDNSWSYSLALFTLLLILGVLPSLIAFRHAFNYERIIHAMASQWHEAKQFYKADGARRETGLSYLSHAAGARENAIKLSDDTTFTRFTALALFATRRNSLDLFKDANGSFVTYIGNTRWTWYKENNILTLKPQHMGKGNLGQQLATSLCRYDLRFNRANIIIVGTLALAYLLLLIKFLAPRIFLFSLNTNLIAADQDLLQEGQNPLATPDKGKARKDLFLRHLFVIGLPFAGKREYVNKLYPPVVSKQCHLDMVSLRYDNGWGSIVTKACQDPYEVVIIDHFEFDIENSAFNNKKLEAFEKLFLKVKKKIIVVSTIHPFQLFEAEPEMRADIKARWNAVLAHFYQIVYPIDGGKSITKDLKKNILLRFIEIECNAGLFLKNLKSTLEHLVEKNKDTLTIPELVVKIRNLAHPYYVSVWNSCSLEEQHLIYDLAEDGLVNTKNTEAITRLIYRGIFIRINALALMNASFRDFVLSYVNPQDEYILRNKISKNGNWNKIRLALYILLAMMALFLLYTQKGFSTQVIGFITSLAAIIPLVLRIFDAIAGAVKAKA
jgi:hypothetical protein